MTSLYVIIILYSTCFILFALLHNIGKKLACFLVYVFFKLNRPKDQHRVVGPRHLTRRRRYGKLTLSFLLTR